MEVTQITWQDVLADPLLQELPYKIELNAEGVIEMSAAPSFQHQSFVAAILLELQGRPNGLALPGCAVQLADGSVRQPDVVWISDERKAAITSFDPLPIAPEICVEVLSPSNTKREIAEKVRLYLEAGALEVWIEDRMKNRTVHRKP